MSTRLKQPGIWLAVIIVGLGILYVLASSIFFGTNSQQSDYSLHESNQSITVKGKTLKQIHGMK